MTTRIALLLMAFALTGCELPTIDAESDEASAPPPSNPTAGATTSPTDTPAPTGLPDVPPDTAVLEPTRGKEVTLVGGRDIRFLAWSPSKGDWVFIGANSGSYEINGDQITGKTFDHPDGGRYYYIGYRPSSTSNPLIPASTGTYAPTHRLYYKKYAR